MKATPDRPAERRRRARDLRAMGMVVAVVMLAVAAPVGADPGASLHALYAASVERQRL